MVKYRVALKIFYTSKLMYVETYILIIFAAPSMATSSSEQKPKVLYISNHCARVTGVLTEEKPSALRSIIAGSTAGAVEIGNVMPGLPSAQASFAFSPKH